MSCTSKMLNNTLSTSQVNKQMKNDYTMCTSTKKLFHFCLFAEQTSLTEKKGKMFKNKERNLKDISESMRCLKFLEIQVILFLCTVFSRFVKIVHYAMLTRQTVISYI